MRIKRFLKLLLAIVAIITVASVAGCAQKTSRPTKEVDYSNWEWVPRVWVEDNSFANIGEYDRCSFDLETEGYWCPPGTK